MNTPEEYAAAMQPKFCRDCKYIARNGSGDVEKFKCLSPKNIFRHTHDLVSGEAIVLTRFYTCRSARQDGIKHTDGSPCESCGTAGLWFEPAPPKFSEPLAPLPVKASNKVNSLLQQLEGM